jgi:hypothetical protein
MVTSANSATVTPLSTTVYTVIGIDFPGCSDTTSITITVKPSPTVSVGAKTLTVCIGETHYLTATGAQSFQWFGNNLISSQNTATVNPSVSTVYSVIGTNQNGCSDSVSILMNVSECVKIDPDFKSNEISIFPNPCSNILNLKGGGTINEFELWNLDGVLMSKKVIENEITEIDLEEIPVGIYCAKIQGTQFQVVVRVIKVQSP